MAFYVLSRFASKYLQYFLKNGCRRWDVITAEILNVLLVSANSGRGGDLALSRAYKPTSRKFLAYRHLRLSLEGGDTIEHLVLRVDLHFLKGDKQTEGARSHKSFEVIKDPALFSSDPVLWLIIHVLRNGLVRAKSLGELDDMAKDPQKKSHWTNGTWPVICQSAKAFSLLLHQPACLDNTVSRTLLEMCAISNCPLRSTCHRLRHGAARSILAA